MERGEVWRVHNGERGRVEGYIMERGEEWKVGEQRVAVKVMTGVLHPSLKYKTCNHIDNDWGDLIG